MEMIKVLWKFFIDLITNPYFIVMAILAIGVDIYYPKFRGFMGEFWVKQTLKKLPNDKYKVLNNIMIKENGNTHQIDHLVLSQFGIFVIEMKNYYGLILGNEYNDKWIQYLGRKKNYFLNPIHQNYGHVKALEKLLNIGDGVFIPIVCFSNQAKLKIETRSNVVPLDYLIPTIKGYRNNILEKDLQELYNRIVELNITDKAARKTHVKDIKNKIKEDTFKVDNMICPKCGGNLVVRNGKYGSFIGCSNYPECKYTKR